MKQLTGLPLLKQVVNGAQPDPRPLYVPERLRFALEIAPDGHSPAQAEAALHAQFQELIGPAPFVLEPLFEDQAGEESYFFTFSPDGIDRTLPEDLLFGIASDLRRALGLISCEPDTGARVFTDPSPEPPATTEGAVLDQTCWVHGTPPQPHDWALNTINVPAAWKLAPGKGRGVVVAQPDTGIAEHQELDQARFDFTRTANLIEGGTQPTDPLTSAMFNPGHGTGTASVLISGESGAISGSAPGATMVPIRCINGVVVFNATPVARAIDHAVSVGAHVITMSLGGVFGRALRAAVRRAVAADVIVLAAAGNCVGLVVWPARYREVIAVGGTNIHDGKWKGSSVGSAVDFSAPAEQVWKALRSDAVSQTNAITPAQGTSFAVALSAGVAALWLERHGHDNAVAEARRRGTSVQELFRAAACQTARHPAGFHSGLGAGVIDAGTLLALPLREIRTGHFESAGLSDDGGLSDALAELFGPGAPDPDFDWAAHGAEVSSLLIADIRAGRGQEGAAPETRAFRLASPDLTDAAAATRDSRIAHLVLRGRPSAPSIMIRHQVSQERLSRLLSNLGAAAQPGLAPEAAAGVSPEEGRAALDKAGRARILAPLQRRAGAGSLAGSLLEESDRALVMMHAEGTSAPLDEGGTLQLEALVSLTGRPAIAVTTRQTPEGKEVQTVDVNDPEFGRFAALAALALPELEQGALGSVGRIDGDGIHLGTGWVIGPGLVVTNRHVLEKFAAPLPRQEDPASWHLYRDARINFSPAANDPARSFGIAGVAFAGRQPVQGLPISFDKLDLAVLSVAATSETGAALPPPVALATSGLMAQQSLFAVGYPAPPGAVPRDEQGQMRLDVIERLREIFHLHYRRKYFSPGVVMRRENAWVLSHDATTLGGNSGSLVGTFLGGVSAAGLHFAGDWLRSNHAHDLHAVLAARPALAELLS